MIDLDKCIDDDGKVRQWAKDIVARFNTYTEISPSRRGLKLLIRAKLPKRSNRCTKKLPWPHGEGAQIELYDSKRYTTLTGHLFDGSLQEVRDSQEELERLYRELFSRKQRVSERTKLANPDSGIILEGASAPQEKGGADGSVDQSILQELTLAVARRSASALLIDANNKADGWKSIREAVAHGDCFAVEVHEDILALDADTSEGAKYMEQELVPAMVNDNLNPVLIASGRPDNRHLSVRITDWLTMDRYASLARDHGIDVRRAIRPPFSPHRLGQPVKLMMPETPEEALSWLRLSVPVRQIKVSGRIWALLKNGDVKGRYKSRSEVVQAIATEAVRTGKGRQWLWTVLTNPNNAGGQKVLELLENRGEAVARAYVAHCYKKAKHWTSTHIS